MGSDENHGKKENNFAPWELPGAVRRDCDSHHADILKVLAELAFALALFSLPCCFLSLVSFPLSVLARMFVKRELSRIDQGTMDPSALHETEWAEHRADLAIMVSWLPFSLASFLLFLWMLGR